MPGYDLSQFVADMGGSLGFLLGLSVLGLIGLFEKVQSIALSYIYTQHVILSAIHSKVPPFRLWL